MASISGAGKFTARLDRMSGGNFVDDISKTLFAVGSKVAADAQISITNGAVSGKGHVASVSPNPPNNDTGQLASEIEVTQVGPAKVEVAAYAPYAAALEFGTSTIAERPFMRPAARKNRVEGIHAITAAVNRSTI